MSSNPKINIDLGNKLQKIRKRQGLTREKLAEKLGVSPRFLADVESGKVGVSVSTLKNIAIVTGTSSDFLLGLTDENDSDIDEIINRITRLDKSNIHHLKNIVREYCNAVDEFQDENKR